MVKLGVNIDHIATLRQARGEFDPDPVMAADDKMRFEVNLNQFLRYQYVLYSSLPGGDTGKVGRDPFLDMCKATYTPPANFQPHPSDDG